MKDMTPEEFRDAVRRTSEWVTDYRERLDDFPVLSPVEPGEVAETVASAPPEEGEPFEALVQDLDDTILPGLTHWNHPGFFAYFPSSSSPPAVLAEFVAAAVNQNAMLWRTSPAGTELEERMVDWIRQLVGLPADFRGVIQDTASAGSFTALLAAREALDVEVRRYGMAGRPDLPSLVMYVSAQGHSSIEKAGIAAGLGQDGVRKVRVDDDWRMDPEALDDRLREDRSAGRLPVMVCATAGTTSTGSVDPLGETARVCRDHAVWLHVDAAYAGTAAMLPELRDRFEGWAAADSIVLNPHKWMSVPIDCSLLLFRDPEAFRRSLALTPEYLETEETGTTDLMDYGLSLGRRFRALKLWFLLRWYGAEGLRSRLRHHLQWAEDFADRVRDDPRFQLMAPRAFSTVCFRALPDRGPEGGAEERGSRFSARPLARGEGVDTLAANDWNRELLDRINRRGRVFLSHTELAGSYVLRLSIGAFTTREAHVARAWEEVVEAHGSLREASGDS